MNNYMSQIIDISYARSLVPEGTTLIGAYSSSWIAGTIERLFVEQKARVGRFFTYHGLLLDLRNRARNIATADPKRGKALMLRVDSALATQSRLEGDGIKIINTLSTIKENPIMKIMLKGELTEEDFSMEIIQRGQTLISNMRTLLSQSASLNSALSDHESVVTRIEKDVKVIEGELVGRGFAPKVTKILEKPIEYMKYVALLGAGVGLVYLLATRKK